ncbi:type VII secretion target [Actinokineospora sp.]|uniref:type VII secretion target n=1 Tax=Actinokineospora sp. TaxID=1872133 RepID=UPI00403782DF
MDEQELVDLIKRELSGRGPRPAPAPTPAPARPESFSVDTAALRRYARDTDALAEELRRIRRKGIAAVAGIADDSFGRIGKDSGFAAALTRFADALGHQVTGVAGNADKLGRVIARTEAAYRREDNDVAADFKKLMA